jgi:hypothetical protein
MFQLACATLLLVSASALAPPQPTNTQNRRQILSSLIGAGIAGVATVVAPQEASATKALTGQGSPFTGDYEDPNHPGCLRQVKVVGAPLRGDGTRSPYPVVEVKGWDGKDGICKERPERSEIWAVEGKLKSKEEATIDFSSKGGPANLLGKWDTDGILFPDGNKWAKIPGGAPDRLPADMRTLTSGPL